MQTNDFSNLPTSWQIKTLGEVCEILDNMRKPINSTEREQRLKNSTTKYAYYGATGQVGYIDDFLCDFESILLGEDGAPFLEPFKDKAYIVSGKYWVNNHAHILKAKENFAINKFVCYFLNIVDYMPYVSGTTRLKLNQSAMKQIKIPLPPLEIQKRIVARLESAFEKIEKGSAHLQDAKTKLAKYKQSLLKSAFDGTLFCHTEGEARSISNQESRDISLTLNMTNSPSLRANEASVAIQNNDTTKAIDCHSPKGLRNDSTHSSLRESAADEAIHKVDCHKSANANFHNDDKSVDCHDLTSSNLAMTDKENPKLPQGWTIKTLGEVLSNDKYAIKRGPFGSSLKKNFFVKSGVRVFEQYNPINQDVEWKRYFITQEKFKELEAFKADAGDLLISCSGTLGKILELPQNVEVGIINQALLKIRLDNTQILNSYFVHLFNSPYMQKIILENTLGSTIQNIASVKELKQIKIPLPPLETQKQIVKLLEKHLQHADKTGEFIESALNKAKQLKQSLLKSAFLGKLT